MAWILLNFNQKRGYYQLRGEDEEEPSNKLKEYCALQVVRVEATDEKKERKHGIMFIWRMVGFTVEQVLFLLSGKEW